MYLTTIFFDQFGVTLNHTADLFALIRVDQEHYFVMTHRCSLRVVACRTMRSDKELIKFCKATTWVVCAMQEANYKEASVPKQGATAKRTD